MTRYKLSENCTVDDATAIAKCNVPAYWGETWWRLLWPATASVDALTEAVAARTPRNLLTDQDVRRHQKVIETTTDDVVGYARWIISASRMDGWLEAQTPDVDEQTREHYQKVFSETPFNSRGDMDSLDDHVYEWRTKYQPLNVLELDYLAVRPDHHRKGIGSMLVKSGVDKAAELGLVICLVAMGRGALDMYLKMGFELVDQKSQDLSPFGADELYETFYLIKKP